MKYVRKVSPRGARLRRLRETLIGQESMTQGLKSLRENRIVRVDPLGDALGKVLPSRASKEGE